MHTILRETYPVARKDYNCDGCGYIINYFHSEDCTFSEKRFIVKARKNEWKIKKGDKYFLQVGIDQGEYYRYRSIPEIHIICCDYDLFPEE